jgi:hypothetical protein
VLGGNVITAGSVADARFKLAMLNIIPEKSARRVAAPIITA